MIGEANSTQRLKEAAAKALALPRVKPEWSNGEPPKPWIYVAARHEDREQAMELAEGLVEEGAVVCSRWIWKKGEEPTKGSERRLLAQQDLQDLSLAHALVFYNPARSHNTGSGGCHTEVGYALALGKVVVVVGGMENVFHDLMEVHTAGGARSVMKVLENIVRLEAGH